MHFAFSDGVATLLQFEVILVHVVDKLRSNLMLYR